MKNYSSFFKTIHDGISPIGHLGQDMHISVLRAPPWIEQSLSIEDVAKYHDFAIIWNEDHVPTIIKTVEKLFSEKLLFPVIFIGKLKGHLSIIVDEKHIDYFDANWLMIYGFQVDMAMQEIDFSLKPTLSIINGNPVVIENDIIIGYEVGWPLEYLRTIKTIWNLGIHSGD